MSKIYSGPRVAIGVGAVLLVGASAVAVHFYLQDSDRKAVLDAQDSAKAAACDYAPTMANYDFANLDAYFAGVLDGATGAWKSEFDGTSKDLREVLSQGQVVSTVGEVQCAIKSASEDSAEAIVVIGQSITSVGTGGKPQPGQLSMVLSLENVEGRWLVDKVDAPVLPAKPSG